MLVGCAARMDCADSKDQFGQQGDQDRGMGKNVAVLGAAGMGAYLLKKMLSKVIHISPLGVWANR